MISRESKEVRCLKESVNVHSLDILLPPKSVRKKGNRKIERANSTFKKIMNDGMNRRKKKKKADENKLYIDTTPKRRFQDDCYLRFKDSFDD